MTLTKHFNEECVLNYISSCFLLFYFMRITLVKYIFCSRVKENIKNMIKSDKTIPT